VNQCDLFIGIYAWRYGHIPAGSDISITAQEYQHAQTLGKPCLCYFVDEDFPWPPKLVEHGIPVEKLAALKAAISREHVRASFREPQQLENNILRDISNWLAENKPELERKR